MYPADPRFGCIELLVLVLQIVEDENTSGAPLFLQSSLESVPRNPLLADPASEIN